MKSNNILTYIYLFTFCLLFACQKETEISKMDDPILCVGPETITDTTSGFLIFEKGTQKFGFAMGTKINSPFNGSANLYLRDTSFTISIETFWPKIDNYYSNAEILVFSGVQFFNENTCLKLTKNQNSSDSIFVIYNVGNDDVGILAYELDTTADNKLEIISFDKEAKKLKARFKASFIGEKEYLPDLPKHVRFVDTYIEVGY